MDLLPESRAESARDLRCAIAQQFWRESLDIIGQNRCHRSLPFQRGGIGNSRSRRTPNCAWNKRGVTEVDVRAMLERATAFEPSVVEGRFMIRVARDSRPWIVIVEPDKDASLLVVVTAYEVSE